MGKIATIGMLDGVHRGHLHLLARLKEKAVQTSRTPIVVTFPDHPLAVIAPEKAPRLLTTPEEKTTLIHEFLPEAEILILPFTPELRSQTAAEFLTFLHSVHGVDALLCGFNNTLGSDKPTPEALEAICRNCGITLFHARELPESKASSTIVRNALTSGNPEKATEILGYPYSITEKIIAGKQIGRKIGFPTANLSIPPRKIIPAAGVYACHATICGIPIRFKAMVNIGYRPTVDPDSSDITIEAHLTDLPAGTDLYGKEITLEFVTKIRDEKKFSDISSLSRQLEEDKKTVSSILS